MGGVKERRNGEGQEVRREEKGKGVNEFGDDKLLLS